MKQVVRFLKILLRTREQIIISLLIFCSVTIAQEQTPPPDEFPVITSVFDTLISNPNLFSSFEITGFNTIWQRADITTQNLLENYNLFAVNADASTEYIYHYSTGYYSKWEAEQNQADPERVGFKHYDFYNPGNTFGDTATWKGKKCWSTKGLSAPACSLMYGPHYRQEKRYKRWHYGCSSGPGCVTYTPRFRMALDNPTGVNSTEDVCVIKVVFRYRVDGLNEHHDTTFIERTLKVGDFDATGSFDDFYLHPNIDSAWYEYWPDFILPDKLAQTPDAPSPVNYIDWESYTGIQFWVDWLRTDTLCTLYIDYAEVYDNDGWNKYIEASGLVEDQIILYAQNFSSWDNIKYWIGTNEPYTIDSYTPIHIVDSLIRSVQAPPLVVHFDPSWTHDHLIDGKLGMNDIVNAMKELYFINTLNEKETIIPSKYKE